MWPGCRGGERARRGEPIPQGRHPEPSRVSLMLLLLLLCVAVRMHLVAVDVCPLRVLHAEHRSDNLSTRKWRE